MADEVHVSLLKQGVEVWNKLRAEMVSALDENGELPEHIPVGLESPNFIGANLAGWNLSGVNFRNARLQFANLNDAVLTNADLSGADLRAAHLLKTDLRNATLTECEIWGVSAWGTRLDGAIQSNLRIAHGPQDLGIEVDDLAVAQFIHLMLDNSNLRRVIDTVNQKAVLILGRFTPERKHVLEAIRTELRASGYVPVLFDFTRPASHDFSETILTLAGLARFVIADITDPRSVPDELVRIVLQRPNLVIAPLLQTGFKPWSTFATIASSRSVLRLHTYTNVEQLLSHFTEKVVGPAERLVGRIARTKHRADEDMRQITRLVDNE
jgi:Pentapeptide repeats (8 copies)